MAKKATKKNKKVKRSNKNGKRASRMVEKLAPIGKPEIRMAPSEHDIIQAIGFEFRDIMLERIKTGDVELNFDIQFSTHKNEEIAFFIRPDGNVIVCCEHQTHILKDLHEEGFIIQLDPNKHTGFSIFKPVHNSKGFWVEFCNAKYVAEIIDGALPGTKYGFDCSESIVNICEFIGFSN